MRDHLRDLGPPDGRRLRKGKPVRGFVPLIDNDDTRFFTDYGFYRIDSRAEVDPISACMRPGDDSALAPRCPKCSGHGLARGLELRLDRYTLRYECDTCRHEWHVTDFVPIPTWNGIPIEPA